MSLWFALGVASVTPLRSVGNWGVWGAPEGGLGVSCSPSLVRTEVVGRSGWSQSRLARRGNGAYAVGIVGELGQGFRRGALPGSA